MNILWETVVLQGINRGPRICPESRLRWAGIGVSKRAGEEGTWVLKDLPVA
jgi:hypothetical protein